MKPYRTRSRWNPVVWLDEFLTGLIELMAAIIKVLD